jgi:hypothetical protein
VEDQPYVNPADAGWTVPGAVLVALSKGRSAPWSTPPSTTGPASSAMSVMSRSASPSAASWARRPVTSPARRGLLGDLVGGVTDAPFGPSPEQATSDGVAAASPSAARSFDEQAEREGHHPPWATS